MSAVTPVPLPAPADGSARESVAAPAASADALQLPAPASSTRRTGDGRQADESGATSRVFLLYITPNDHVQEEKKLTIRAATLGELIECIREEMNLPSAWNFVPCQAAGSSVCGLRDPTPYENLNDVKTRSVLQLWPRIMFSASQNGDEASLSSELYRAAVRGDDQVVARTLELLGSTGIARPSCIDTADGDVGSDSDSDTGINSALHAAAYYGNSDCVRLFIDQWGDASLSSRNRHGQTVLHCAARGGQDRVVEMLLREGADPILLDASQYTARDIAVRQGHQSTAKLLEAPEVECKAHALGLVSADAALERKLTAAQQSCELMREQLRACEAKLVTQEQEWRERLEAQQIRRMEAMEQLKADFEKQSAAQMYEAFRDH